MKILVTGGAGFIGSHLVRQLQKNDIEFVVLDNLSTGNKRNLPPDVRLKEMDIRDPNLSEFFRQEKFDATVHLAGQTMVNESIQNPKLDASVNVMGTINLLEAMKSGDASKIIFASTAAVYGNVDDKNLPIRETEPLNPKSFYALTKMTAENYLRIYHEIFGTEYVILRFANVYGKYQSNREESGVIGIFSKLMAQGKQPIIYGDGTQTRDFIHAEDIAAGIIAALRTENKNTVYNLSSQTEVTLNALINLLGKVIGCDVKPKYLPERFGDIKHSSLSNEKAKKFLKWRPKITLLEGLKRTYSKIKKYPADDVGLIFFKEVKKCTKN